jgi:hypothetical protein
MDALVGFHVDKWDYITFAALGIIGAAFLALLVLILGLPGRIAIARNHPDADAVNLMGWVGFLAIVPWIQALIWAFKPTDVIDIRNLPEQERRETAAMIARLTGKKPPAGGEPPPEDEQCETAAMMTRLSGKEPPVGGESPPSGPANK